MTTKLYKTMYEYVRDADISHYRMSGNGKTKCRIEAFNPADDPDFAIDNNNTKERDGKTYIPVCWGEEKSSALMESEISTAQCWILYRYNPATQEYVSDGRIYKTRTAAKRAA